MNKYRNKRQNLRLVIFLFLVILEILTLFFLLRFCKFANVIILINYLFALLIFLIIGCFDCGREYKTIALIFLIFMPIISTIGLLTLIISVKKNKQTGHYQHAHYENAKYFNNGERFFSDFTQELRLAKKRIYLEFYIIKKGKVWDSIRNIIIEKARSGVDVRIVYDAFGCQSMPFKFKKWLLSHNIKAFCFNPLNPLNFFSGCRTHRKIAVVDSNVYLGGINIADEYLNAPSPFGKWKDCAIKMQGDISDVFARSVLAYFNKPLQQTKNAKSPNHASVYLSTPFGVGVLKDVYVETLYSSNTISFTTPYFVPDSEFMHALRRALETGKTIKIFLPSVPDKKIIYAVSNYYAQQASSYGAEIYLYKPGFLHSKLCLTESKAIIGSGNLDCRSFYLQRECGVIINKGNLYDAVIEDFEKISSSSEPAVFCKKSKIHAVLSALFFKAIAPFI